ncbi:MAG: hypothetical protein ACYTFG_02475 [Planctomycetota bacterium]|jgi:hypothetical protein
MTRPSSLRYVLGAVLITVVCVPAIAGEADPPDPEAQAAAFLETLTEFDESLLGEQWFGIYVGDGKQLGTYHVVVERPGDGEPGAYRVKTTLKLALGELKLEEKKTLFLAKDMSLLESAYTKTTAGEPGKGGKRSIEKQSFKRVGDEWVCEAVVDEMKVKYFSPVPKIDHGDRECAFMLCRKLGEREKVRFHFEGLAWPNPMRNRFEELTEKKQEVRLDGARLEKIRFYHEKNEKVAIRGENYEARVVFFDDARDRSEYFYVSRAGDLLMIKPKGTPISFIAGTEEECSKNLPGMKSAEPDGPRSVVVRLMKVTEGHLPESELNDIVAWDEFLKEAREREGEGGPKNMEALKGGMTKWLKEEKEGLPEATVEAVLDLLEVKREGDRAVVSFPARSEIGFEMRKIEGKWKLVYMPMLDFEPDAEVTAKPMSEELIEKVCNDAFDDQFQAFVKGEQVDTMTSLNEAAKAAGFKDYNDFAMKAAMWNADAFSKIMKKATERYVKKIQEHVEKEAEKGGEGK